jgi:hypothetical protein
VEEWKQCLENGELVGVVAMDLSKAFDSLPHSLFISKLKAYGLDDQSYSLIEDYLRDRLQRVKIGDTFPEWEQIVRGVPQGSVLGPLFFKRFFLFHYGC